MCSNWLAATARKEVQRFKEFIAWIKYGVFATTSPSYFVVNGIDVSVTQRVNVRPTLTTKRTPHPRHATTFST